MPFFKSKNRALRRWVVLWFAFFGYTLLLGLLIQLVILPYVFPAWHEGNGLLKGYDYSRFHQLALELSHQIRQHGWSQWELSPGGQPVAGIAAIFYVLVAPEPWSVLPANAFAHAASGLLMVSMLLRVCRGFKAAAMATVAFIVSPTALSWTAQMHNDSISILGVLLYAHAWTFMAVRLESLDLRAVAVGLGQALGGLFLITIVRPYLVEVMALIGASIALILSAVLIYSCGRRALPCKLALARAAGLAIVLLLPSYLIVSRQGETRLARRLLQASSAERARGSQDDLRQGALGSFEWQDSRGLLPPFIDAGLKALSYERYRNSRAWRHGTSNLDLDRQFHNAGQVFRYVPRALQISLLAPFPSMWTGEGSRESSSLMRRIGGVEMVFVYVILLMLIPSMFRWWRSPAYWTMLAFAILSLVVLGMVTPNVGSLVRFRYPFFMIVVSISLRMWIEALGAASGGKRASRFR
jgi:hypothetical protein